MASAHIRSVRTLDRRLISVSLASSAIPGPANVRHPAAVRLRIAAASPLPRPLPAPRHQRRRGRLDGERRGGADDGRAAADRGDAGHRAERRRRRLVHELARRHDRWETFHIDQLVPWVDANLRTIRARGARDRGPVAGRFLLDELRGPASRSVRDRAVVLGCARHRLRRRGARELVPIINPTEIGLDHVPPTRCSARRDQRDQLGRARSDDAGRQPPVDQAVHVHRQRHAGPARFDAASTRGEPIEAGVHQLTRCSTSGWRSSGSRVSPTTTDRAPTAGRTGRATCASRSGR